MRIEETYYGDYIVRDEMPFNTSTIAAVALTIEVQDGISVQDWPVTIEHYESTGYWTLYFTRPVTDEEYEAMSTLPAELSIDY